MFDIRPFVMKTNIEEKEKEFIVTVEVPGCKKEDVEVRVEKDTLIVEATTKIKGTHFIRNERESGKFIRRYMLGDIYADGIKASLNDGVLTITVPKEDILLFEPAHTVEIA